MTTKRWLAEQEPRWERLEQLLDASRLSTKALSSPEIRELALLYRGAINDLARVQSSAEYRHLEPYLNNLVQRGHGRVYERPPTRLKDVLDFFLRDFPRCFRQNAGLIGLAAVMFFIGSAIAMLTIHLDPDTEAYFMPPPVIEQLDHGILWTDQTGAAPSQSSFLMTNNIRVAINAFAFGVLLGVGTLLLMLHNGMFAFGGPLMVCIRHGMGLRLLTFITAHGVIELTTIFIAGGAGMLIGFAMLFPGDRPRWQAVRLKAQEAFILIMGCFPLLVIAGLIEGLISLNRDVGIVPRLTVAAASFIFLVAYLGFSGRESHFPRSPVNLF